MPFTKTEVDIHDDYVVEAVDAAWLSQGVKSPKHLMLDPDNCILCRACEDVCPWNCIYMLSTGIVEGATEDVVEDEVDNATAIFVVDDNACTRCSVCVDRCPTDTLYYARLPEGSSGKRTMAEVPASQASERSERRTVARGEGKRVKLKPPSPSDVGDRIRETEVWKSIFRPGSIFRQGYKDTSRDRALATMNNVLYHLHPVKVKRHGLKLTYTFCLGGLSFFLFILLDDHRHLPDVLLPAHGRPRRRSGYTDMQAIRTSVFFGDLVRNLHRWGAHLMVFSVSLHMARVFYTGSYKPPREFNWVVGVDPAVPHAGVVVHRLPAPLGPARDLGRHRGYLARRLFTVHREAGQLPAAGRRRGRTEHPVALVRAPRARASVRAGDLPRGALLAHPQGRRHLRTAVRSRR